MTSTIYSCLNNVCYKLEFPVYRGNILECNQEEHNELEADHLRRDRENIDDQTKACLFGVFS